jgi:hypothetical protein
MSFAENIGMFLRGTPVRRLRKLEKISKENDLGLTTMDLEAHFLSGGDPEGVIEALIRAKELGVETDFNMVCALDLSKAMNPLEAVTKASKEQHLEFDTFSSAWAYKILATTRSGDKVGARIFLSYRLSPLKLALGFNPQVLQEMLSSSLATNIRGASCIKELKETKESQEKKLLEIAKSIVASVSNLKLEYLE